MKKVIMPRMDVDMDSGVVVEWLKSEGEEVREGEPIVKVMSEKVTYEVPSPASGKLYRCVVKAGEEVPVATVIGVIMEEGDTVEELEKAVEEAKAAVKPAVKEERRVLATPMARRLARQYGIDLTKVVGTGPGGRITKEDVLRLVEEAKAVGPKVARVIPLTGYRKSSAERLARSFREAPHASVSTVVDMTEAVRLREELKGKGVRVSYTAMVVKAVAKALREHPEVNSTYEDGVVKVWGDVNVCVAVATDEGLTAPVVRQADKLGLRELSDAIDDLAERARAKRLEKRDVEGGTFTVTNLGMYGVETFTPVINPPQAAILAVGRIAKRPMVVGDSLEVRDTAVLTLTFDHRVLDGVPAAEFLSRVKELLEDPSWMT